MFNLEKLIVDVLNPLKGDTVTIICDIPHSDIQDNQKWIERRQMAVEWREAFVLLSKKIGFKVLPLIEFPASGAHSKAVSLKIGAPLSIQESFGQSTIALAMTEFSISPLLMNYSVSRDDFRSVSMPISEKRMESSALSADHTEIYRRCIEIEKLMQNIIGAEVEFSTGHKCFFDLRYREVRKDAGRLHKKDIKEFPMINLPTGEVYQAPYEGEKDSPSKTSGFIPAFLYNESVLLEVKENKIIKINDFETGSDYCNSIFEKDPARRNIAEFAIGCNTWAEVSGNILEDEKAGFHWAFGRSEHIGGTVGPENFISSETVMHLDVVYAKDSKYQINHLEFIYGDGSKKTIVENQEYLIY